MTLHTSEAEKVSLPLEISLDEAKALLARAVAEKGSDFVYTAPRIDGEGPLNAYFNPEDGCPSCMVGYVLSYKGLTIDDLRYNDPEATDQWATRNVHADVDTLVEHRVLLLDLETEALLSVVQTEQDQGQTWGRALGEALATYEDRAEDYEDDDPSLDYWF